MKTHHQTKSGKTVTRSWLLLALAWAWMPGMTAAAAVQPEARDKAVQTDRTESPYFQVEGVDGLNVAVSQRRCPG